MSGFDIINKIPVVGYSKAVVHYAFGETEEGHRAVYESTRSTAVVGGGLVGAATGGPGGAFAGGMTGACLTDCGATWISGKSQGIVKDYDNVEKDIIKGRDPTRSVLRTAANHSLDGLGGYVGSYGCRCPGISRGVGVYPSMGRW